jgi:hypothetical protein
MINKILKLKKYKLKLRFGSIKDKDLNYTIGKESEMLEKLADKLGKTKEEMLGILIEY